MSRRSSLRGFDPNRLGVGLLSRMALVCPSCGRCGVLVEGAPASGCHFCCQRCETAPINVLGGISSGGDREVGEHEALWHYARNLTIPITRSERGCSVFEKSSLTCARYRYIRIEETQNFAEDFRWKGKITISGTVFEAEAQLAGGTAYITAPTGRATERGRTGRSQRVVHALHGSLGVGFNPLHGGVGFNVGYVPSVFPYMSNAVGLGQGGSNGQLTKLKRLIVGECNHWKVVGDRCERVRRGNYMRSGDGIRRGDIDAIASYLSAPGVPYLGHFPKAAFASTALLRVKASTEGTPLVSSTAYDMPVDCSAFDILLFLSVLSLTVPLGEGAYSPATWDSRCCYTANKLPQRFDNNSRNNCEITADSRFASDESDEEEPDEALEPIEHKGLLSITERTPREPEKSFSWVEDQAREMVRNLCEEIAKAIPYTTVTCFRQAYAGAVDQWSACADDETWSIFSRRVLGVFGKNLVDRFLARLEELREMASKGAPLTEKDYSDYDAINAKVSAFSESSSGRVGSRYAASVAVDHIFRILPSVSHSVTGRAYDVDSQARLRKCASVVADGVILSYLRLNGLHGGNIFGPRESLGHCRIPGIQTHLHNICERACGRTLKSMDEANKLLLTGFNHELRLYGSDAMFFLDNTAHRVDGNKIIPCAFDDAGYSQIIRIIEKTASGEVKRDVVEGIESAGSPASVLGFIFQTIPRADATLFAELGDSSRLLLTETLSYQVIGGKLYVGEKFPLHREYSVCNGEGDAGEISSEDILRPRPERPDLAHLNLMLGRCHQENVLLVLAEMHRTGPLPKNNWPYVLPLLNNGKPSEYYSRFWLSHRGKSTTTTVQRFWKGDIAGNRRVLDAAFSRSTGMTFQPGRSQTADHPTEEWSPNGGQADALRDPKVAPRCPTREPIAGSIGDPLMDSFDQLNAFRIRQLMQNLSPSRQCYEEAYGLIVKLNESLRNQGWEAKTLLDAYTVGNVRVSLEGNPIAVYAPTGNLRPRHAQINAQPLL